MMPGLLAHLDALSVALAERDLARVNELITGPGSTRIPRSVREEALAVVALPLESLRAPIALWAFYHQTVQLLAQEPERDMQQLELPLSRRRRRTA
jgi:hypothetical protein